MNTIYEEYKLLRKLNSDIENTKHRLVNSIMRKVKPFMWNTGYVWRPAGEPIWSDKGRPLKAFFFEMDKCYKIPHYIILEEFIGFTESNAVAIDAHAGGLATSNLYTLPIEDLIKLWSWVERDKYKHFVKPTKRN